MLIFAPLLEALEWAETPAEAQRLIDCRRAVAVGFYTDWPDGEPVERRRVPQVLRGLGRR